MLNGKKILIIRLSAIGDTIHTLPMISALKKQYPNCEIGWVVENKAKLFIENNPLIDKCFVIDKKRKNFFKIIKKIRKEKYDIALDPQQLLKSGIILGLCGAKKKITLSGGRELSWIFANKIIKAKRKLFDKDYHVVKRNLELCESLGCNVDEINFSLPAVSDEDKKTADGFLAEFSKPVVALSPATTWKNKHISNDIWIEILNYLKGKADVILTGTITDKGLINHIIESSDFNEAKNIAGETDLSKLREIYSRCKLVITPDSGSTHIAWATQKPAVISFFTATSAKRTAPFSINKESEGKYYSFQAEIDCSPCMKKLCLNKTEKDVCSKSFDIEKVKKIIDLILT